jgi:serine/threonine protein kinase
MTDVAEIRESFDSRGYRLIEQLGAGSYGEVQLYYNPVVGFRAVKFINASVFTEREVRCLCALRHVATTRVYAYGIPSDPGLHPWIEMAYIPGGTLCELIASRRTRLTDDESLTILYGTAHVLRALHSQGIVHRDVKSGNVFIDEYMEPHLGDFGFARQMGSDMTGCLGTLIYAAPELLGEGRLKYGTAVDVWAFGMLVYEVRTGQVPSWGTTIQEKIREAIIKGVGVPQLHTDDPFYSLFAGCVVHDPDKRWTMDRCVMALDALGGDRLTAYKQKLAEWKEPEKVTIDAIQRLADAGFVMSCFALGVIRARGIGAGKDFSVAAHYLRKAEAKGWGPAGKYLLYLMDKGKVTEGVDGEMRAIEERAGNFDEAMRRGEPRGLYMSQFRELPESDGMPRL